MLEGDESWESPNPKKRCWLRNPKLEKETLATKPNTPKLQADDGCETQNPEKGMKASKP